MKDIRYNKVEEKILNAATAEEYIDLTLKSQLSAGRKGSLCREWRKRSGLSIKDVMEARNKHPYWKKKKVEKSLERTKDRIKAHDYSKGKPVIWTKDLVTKFIEMNKIAPNGKYENADSKLAEHFKTTLPSIQYMRRKNRAALSLLGAKSSKDKLLEVMLRAEMVIKAGPDALNKPRYQRAPGTEKKVSVKAPKIKKEAVKKATKPIVKKALAKELVKAKVEVKKETKAALKAKAKPVAKAKPEAKAKPLAKVPAKKALAKKAVAKDAPKKAVAEKKTVKAPASKKEAKPVAKDKKESAKAKK